MAGTLFREYTRFSIPPHYIKYEYYEDEEDGEEGYDITYTPDHIGDLISKLRSAGFPIPPNEAGKSDLISAGPTIGLYASFLTEEDPDSGAAIVVRVPQNQLNNNAFLDNVDVWIDQAGKILYAPEDPSGAAPAPEDNNAEDPSGAGRRKTRRNRRNHRKTAKKGGKSRRNRRTRHRKTAKKGGRKPAHKP
jgi:hypothetical protein